MDRTHTFVTRLIEIAPDLRQICDAHLEANDELLPHVFMGDVTRYIVANIMRGNDLAVTEILKAAEQGLTPGSGLEVLIKTSFVENLIGENEAISKLLRLAGPRLGAEIRRQTSS